MTKLKGERETQILNNVALSVYTFFLRLLKLVICWIITEEYIKYRVSVKSFPDYKHLLQENYVEYKHMQL
jgi:hypothetical protein